MSRGPILPSGSAAWLRLRCAPEALLLLILTAAAVVKYTFALPHPLGVPMVMDLHLANLIPALLTAAAGAVLRPRWDAAYAAASAGASTVIGRVVIVAATAAAIGLVWVGLVGMGAVPTLMPLVAAHAAAGCGVACAVHGLVPRAPSAPLAAGVTVALALGVSPWWAATEPVFGDAAGAGGMGAVRAIEFAVGAAGAVMLIAAGRRRG